MNIHTNWQSSSTGNFWSEIAPCEHVVHIYENDEAFLDLLEGFVSDGLNAGESIILIATAKHLQDMAERLKTAGFDLFTLSLKNQYIPLEAEETLARFMVNGWPDENLFGHLITDLLRQARKGGRKVRAFGEMVALLWERGNSEGTVALENMWNRFCEKEKFTLFCGYQQHGFSTGSDTEHIYSAHTKMIRHTGKSQDEILYRHTQASAGDA